MSAKIRNTNIEVLRIISMLMIVAFHSVRIVAIFESQSLYIRIFTEWIRMWGILGVWIFVIISAWFLCAQELKIQKVIYVLIQTYTWILGYYLAYIVYICGHLDYEFTEIIKTVLKTIIINVKMPQHYWFVTAYVFMLLASPMLNKLLNSMDKKHIEKVLIIFSFIPIYSQYIANIIVDVFAFLYAYLLIGYLKQHAEDLRNRIGKRSCCLTIFIIIIALRICCLTWKDSFLVRQFGDALICRHSAMLLIFAVSIFFNTLKIKPTYNKQINTIASYTLGVYLFHEFAFSGFDSTLDIILSGFMSKGLISPGIYFPIQCIISFIFIFMLGVLLEYIRSIIIQKPCMRFITKRYGKYIEKVNFWINDI